MRILHLATSLSGGAGIAARRICEAQREAGLNSRILAGGISPESKLKAHERIIEVSKLRASLSSLNTVFQSAFLQKDDRLVTSFSVNQPVLHQLNFAEFDLVHLHAFYNLINYKSIIHISKNLPLVVTMHDQRFFTGGCHYSFNCVKYNSTCADCPQTRRSLDFIPEKTLIGNYGLLTEAENISFISPSSWLMERAKSSKLIGRFQHNQVYNPVPQDFVSGESRIRDGKVLNIGFVSQNINNPYKGLKVLMDALSKVEGKRNIHLRIFGSGKLEYKLSSSEITQVNFENDKSASIAYKSCDLIIVPSEQDNLPSVVSEALMCGVPVIGSNIGGIGEILKIFNLPTFESGDVNRLASLIEGFASKLTPNDLSKKADSLFSYEASANYHSQIYQKSIIRYRDQA
jgi:glycosyltransferase involved in cell wall biosynthesis